MPGLLTDQNFQTVFEKNHPKEHFYEMISKSDQWFHRRRFFKEFVHVRIVKEAHIH